MQIQLPNDWRCRPHQRELWRAMAPVNGLKRGVAVWHRRGGKDNTAINLTAVKAHQRVGTYWHLLPTSVQSRRVVWNETDGQGRRIIDQAFPHELRETTRTDDMSIRFLNGSFWQLGGSDHYNSLVGSNVVGVVFSEWALCDPAAWDYIRPILVENGGWALFIYTPRGRNHGWDMWRAAQASAARWFASKLTIRDTQREDGTPIVTEQQVADEKADGMSDDKAEQEFFCSFAAGVEGAYFARYVERAREEDRIGSVPWSSRYAVHLYFDLGIDDATAVWFGQRVGWMRRWFLYLEFHDRGLSEVFQELAAMPYRYGSINLPHDGRQRDKGTGRTLVEYAEDAWEGQRAQVIAHPAGSKQDLIDGGRVLIGQSYFDEEGCKRGLDCLLNYRKIWDERRKVYQQQPLHDWASHGASAWELAGMLDIDQPVHEYGDAAHTPRVHAQVNGSIRR